MWPKFTHANEDSDSDCTIELQKALTKNPTFKALYLNIDMNPENVYRESWQWTHNNENEALWLLANFWICAPYFMWGACWLPEVLYAVGRTRGLPFDPQRVYSHLLRDYRTQAQYDTLTFIDNLHKFFGQSAPKIQSKLEI